MEHPLVTYLDLSLLNRGFLDQLQQFEFEACFDHNHHCEQRRVHDTPNRGRRLRAVLSNRGDEWNTNQRRERDFHGSFDGSERDVCHYNARSNGYGDDELERCSYVAYFHREYDRWHLYRVGNHNRSGNGGELQPVEHLRDACNAGCDRRNSAERGRRRDSFVARRASQG